MREPVEVRGSMLTSLKNPAPACIRHLVVTLILCLSTDPVAATSVRQLTFAELCDHSDLVIEGRVVAAEAREDGLGGGIGTYIRIEVLDRLKGPDVGAELELRFAGGTVAGHSLTISDLRIPEVGEVGIYFVESLRERHINPLVGWSQGHFLELVDEQTGLPRVFTPDKRAVLGVGSSASSLPQRQILSGDGTALEVQVAAARGPSQAAMSAIDFKTLVRQGIAARGTPP